MIMRAPGLSGVLERRLLVNYRLDPDAAQRLLPDGMEPDLANGYAVGGICLVRLGGIRPPGLPAAIGLRSENAAHRIAVRIDGPDGPQRGVFIPRRDTESALNAFAGGRLFPGEHPLARFQVRERGGEIAVSYVTRDRTTNVKVLVNATDQLTGSALFDNLDSASAFFRGAPVGYSARSSGPILDALELRAHDWQVEPVEIIMASSTFFEDRGRFPAGSASLDCALLMRDTAVTWIPRGRVAPADTSYRFATAA